MSHYYHVNTGHANYNAFVSKSAGIHNASGAELSITENIAGTEAIIKVKNGLIVTPQGLVINVYTDETHDQIFDFFYTDEWQASE
ncbi:MAG: hypothetical protein KAT90_01455 [Gammaproteobacteria bacterium]|nr:hypothetical protein [Gammaproteobacteria bacterium]